MNLSDEKVQEAISKIEGLIIKTQELLLETKIKEDTELAYELMSAWNLIINQCEIASDARNVLQFLNSISDNDNTL